MNRLTEQQQAAFDAYQEAVRVLAKAEWALSGARHRAQAADREERELGLAHEAAHRHVRDMELQLRTLLGKADYK